MSICKEWGHAAGTAAVVRATGRSVERADRRRCGGGVEPDRPGARCGAPAAEPGRRRDGAAPGRPADPADRTGRRCGARADRRGDGTGVGHARVRATARTRRGGGGAAGDDRGRPAGAGAVPQYPERPVLLAHGDQDRHRGLAGGRRRLGSAAGVHRDDLELGAGHHRRPGGVGRRPDAAGLHPGDGGDGDRWAGGGVPGRRADAARR
ncbi:hypothetical protein [Cellulomonas taurus]|uniref:hypothetical protein n=1 Tax=Cellulomonas taurus TaxID=2729175 RepID=UPI003CCE531B